MTFTITYQQKCYLFFMLDFKIYEFSYWTYLSYLWRCNSNLSSKIHQLDIKKIQNLLGHIQKSTWYAFLWLYLCHPILLPFPSKKLHSKVYHNLLIRFWTSFSFTSHCVFNIQNCISFTLYLIISKVNVWLEVSYTLKIKNNKTFISVNYGSVLALPHVSGFFLNFNL